MSSISSAPCSIDTCLADANQFRTLVNDVFPPTENLCNTIEQRFMLVTDKRVKNLMLIIL